jgi:hypothetical protein
MNDKFWGKGMKEMQDCFKVKSIILAGEGVGGLC